ncbi:MAG: hypothetical protein ACPGR2_06895 [Psychrobium sp.]
MCLTTPLVSNALSLNAAPKLMEMMNLMSSIGQGVDHCINDLVHALCDSPNQTAANKLINDDLCMFCDEIFSMVRSTMPQVLEEYSDDIDDLNESGELDRANELATNIHLRFPSLAPLNNELTNQQILAYCDAMRSDDLLIDEYLAIFKPLYNKVETSRFRVKTEN